MIIFLLLLALLNPLRAAANDVWTGTHGETGLAFSDMKDFHLYVTGKVYKNNQPSPDTKITPLIRCVITDAETFILQFPDATTDSGGVIKSRIDRHQIHPFLDENYNFAMCKVWAKAGDQEFEILTPSYTGIPLSYKTGVFFDLRVIDVEFYNLNLADNKSIECSSYNIIVMNKSTGNIRPVSLASDFKGGKLVKIMVFRPKVFENTSVCTFGSIAVDSDPSTYDDKTNAADLKTKCMEKGATCWYLGFTVKDKRDNKRYYVTASTPNPKAGGKWLRLPPNSNQFVYHHVQ